jgi:ParB-like chromosome segregation protein Spo0J
VPPFIDLEQSPILMVSIRSLRVIDSPRRCGENAGHIRALAESENELPPIIVHRSTMQVIDGVHRLRAAQRRGEEKIAARFFDGDAATSYVLAVEANIKHGLPLSLADRKAAAVRIVHWYPQWSDRMIASVTGLAGKTVARIREREARGGRPTEEVPHLDARMGRDGRIRPRKGAEGRERAVSLILQNPNASLREIAQKAGISPETVRAVRNSLAQGGQSRRSLPQRVNGPVPAVVAMRAGAPRWGGEAAEVAGKDTGGSAAIRFLRGDPSFRSTDGGRAFLRMVSVSQALKAHCRSIIEKIPLHCLDRAADACRECAEIWREFAEAIDRQKNIRLTSTMREHG